MLQAFTGCGRRGKVKVLGKRRNATKKPKEPGVGVPNTRITHACNKTLRGQSSFQYYSVSAIQGPMTSSRFSVGSASTTPWTWQVGGNLWLKELRIDRNRTGVISSMELGQPPLGEGLGCGHIFALRTQISGGKISIESFSTLSTCQTLYLTHVPCLSPLEVPVPSHFLISQS